jgi:A/G-specific adenine glycosylase
MMLQQTTVQTVVPYWQRFMARFPDVASLAAADEEQVLGLWSGLGYYRRARSLHRAAGIIVAERKGHLPADRAGWAALPGIGDYASGAIAIFGLGERVAALDANARRVITRWIVAEPGQLPRLTPRKLEEVGASLVDQRRPGAWNEAVMELGALVCRASSPDCDACPVRAHCRAYQCGHTERVPAVKERVRSVPVQLAVLALAWDDRFLLSPPGSSPVRPFPPGPEPVREEFSGLHQGLWGLPMTVWLPPLGEDDRVWDPAVWRPWLEQLGLGAPEIAGGLRHLGRFTHAITRYRLGVEVYGARIPAGFRPPPGVLLDKAATTVPRSKSAGGDPGAIRAQGPVFVRFVEGGLPISKMGIKGIMLARKAFY